MSNILGKISAFIPKYHTADICGVEFKFYSPRMKTLMSGAIAQVVKPIFSALSVLFSDKDQDVTRSWERTPDGSQASFTQAASAETISLRAAQVKEALDTVVGLIFSDETRYQLGLLLADSLRDDFSSKESDRALESRHFVDALTPEQFGLMCMAYFKVLMPLMDDSGNSALSAIAKRLKEEVGRRMADLGELQVEKTQSASQSQSPQPTTE